MTTYLRYQSPTPNRRGTHPGVFGLVNGLARDGLLTPGQEQFRLVTNAWYEANVTDPATVDPSVYDRAVNPRAAAWFKESAHDVIGPVDGYLEILAEHGVECVLVRCTDPGRVIYEDDRQIVVVPHEPATSA
jgi:hypothetical protein